MEKRIREKRRGRRGRRGRRRGRKAKRYVFFLETCVFWVFSMIARVLHGNYFLIFSKFVLIDHPNPRFVEFMWVKP